jgi:hypothetical protein
MHIFKKLAMLITVTGLALGFATCASAQVTWTLSDVYFDNGNTATGFFTTNSSLSVTSFSLQVTGPDTAQDFTASTFVDSYLPNTVGFANSDFSEYVDLYLISSITNAGGVIPFGTSIYGNGSDCGGSGGCGTLLIGDGYTPELNGTTPEPATVGLMLLGLGLLLGTRIAKGVRRTTATNRA